MNYCRRVVTRNKRNWIYALKPKGTKLGYSGSDDIIENGHQVFGSEVAPKTSTIIHSMELGKPVVLPNPVGALQRVTMVQRVKDMEKSKGQPVIGCIEAYAFIRKDADFP